MLEGDSVVGGIDGDSEGMFVGNSVGVLDVGALETGNAVVGSVVDGIVVGSCGDCEKNAFICGVGVNRIGA